MSIAGTVERFLMQQRIPYRVLSHPRAATSLEAAKLANIEGRRLAKAVLLEDDAGYLMAVVPANRHVKVRSLGQQLGRKVHMATEEEAASLFADCERGAIPPLGRAYGIEAVWDDSLLDQPEIFFEGGDHEELIQVAGQRVQALMEGGSHGDFSSPML